ncbi:MAG: molecular chaperone HtpG [Hyphomicrobiales bacterium]|nr:molecular chaperone HtpG [Hyphomicrobiales bacterium]
MVHSVYSDRDVFLRELISNASDACEKLRFEVLANPELANPELATGAGDPHISITIDKDASTLIVQDNGIGMNGRDLAEALGTIANSGTRAYLEKLKAQEAAQAASDAKPAADGGEEKDADTGAKSGSAASLIGQFGIGFYSAFMVADTVDVFSRKAGEQQAWKWSSQGEGTYTLAETPSEEAPETGTRVVLHIREDAKEFLETWKLESIIRQYSGSITIPIDLFESPAAEAKRVTDGTALWARSRNDITGDEYTEFYREVSRQFDEPDQTIHWRAEGRHEYTVLAFIPGSRPMDLFDPQRKGRSRLYVRRVLITDDADLLPGWLRFVRVVVDSADMPLNVSREMIQKTPVFAAIQKAVTNRIVQELKKLAKDDPEKFDKIWGNFGAVLKEGLYEDFERRDDLFGIARFETTASGEGRRSLAQYVNDLRPNQTAIYYIAGDDAKRLAASPQIEGFKKRGIEVLILSDPVDSFWVSNALGYDGKPFKSATQGAVDLKDIPLTDPDEKTESENANTPEMAAFIALAKQALGEEVEDVRTTDRLAGSPACIVAPESGMDRRLERLLAEHGQALQASRPVLEINPDHPLIRSLAANSPAPGDKTLLEDAVWLLFDEAKLVDGEQPADMAAFANRLFSLMTRAVG